MVRMQHANMPFPPGTFTFCHHNFLFTALAPRWKCLAFTLRPSAAVVEGGEGRGRGEGRGGRGREGERERRGEREGRGERREMRMDGREETRQKGIKRWRWIHRDSRT